MKREELLKQIVGQLEADGHYELSKEALSAFHPTLTTETTEEVITLPRKMDEDLYYIVGGAMGAQSPEQCGRADALWDKLVAKSDAATKRKPHRLASLKANELRSEGFIDYPVCAVLKKDAQYCVVGWMGDVRWHGQALPAIVANDLTLLRELTRKADDWEQIDPRKRLQVRMDPAEQGPDPLEEFQAACSTSRINRILNVLELR